MKVCPTTPPSFQLTAIQPAAAKMQELAQDYGVAVCRRALSNTTRTGEAGADTPPNCWRGEANPKLIYRAADGPGRTFIMGAVSAFESQEWG